MSAWHQLRGYLVLRITGYGGERFMNMLSYKGVYLWHVQRNGREITLKTSKDALPLIEYCMEKTHCHVEILEERGLPAVAKKSKGRELLVYGFFSFMLGLYLLSTLIWSVEVTGNTRVSTEDLLAFCAEYDISSGKRKKTIDQDDVARRLLLSFPELSWVSIALEGTNVHIKVAETIVQPELVDKETLTEIVATSEGVITKVVVNRGTPLVAIGDVVSKNDVVIGNEIIMGEEGSEQQIEYVSADGEVYAKMWRTLQEEMPLSYEEKVYTNENTTNTAVRIGDLRIDFVQPTLTDLFEVEVVKEQELALGEFSFGIAIITEEYIPYIVETHTRTEAEAKILLEEKLRSVLEVGLTKQGIVESVNYTYETYLDCVRGIAQGVVVDEIGEKIEWERDFLEEEMQ
ncbi:MAG: sporulation protein YqfD [Bacillota bacterium]